MKKNTKLVKILQVGNTNTRGGIESFLKNSYDSISGGKYQIDFLEMWPNMINGQYYKEKGSNIFKIDNYSRHPIKYIKTLREILKKGKYDILHYNMNSAVFLYPLIAAKLEKIPIIIAHSHNASNDKGALKSILHSINKHAIPFLANTYAACSHKAARYFFGRKIIQGEKYSIIPNSIDYSKFTFSDKKRIAIRKELDVKNNTFLIGHIGRFSKQKNHKFIIEIADMMRNQNIQFALIGTGPEKAAIKALIRAKQIENMFILLEPREYIEKYYSAFDCFILPSLYEGLPFVGVEAQVSGCKCFFSNTITDELIISPIAKMLPIDNPSVWATEIKNTIKQQSARDAKCDNRYSISVNKQKLMKLYDAEGLKR
jgi:glycosyltransferase involved in cell wall biosynthesis